MIVVDRERRKLKEAKFESNSLQIIFNFLLKKKSFANIVFLCQRVEHPPELFVELLNVLFRL